MGFARFIHGLRSTHPEQLGTDHDYFDL